MLDLFTKLKKYPFTLSTSPYGEGKRKWCISFLGEDMLGNNLQELLEKVLAEFERLEEKHNNGRKQRQ